MSEIRRLAWPVEHQERKSGRGRSGGGAAAQCSIAGSSDDLVLQEATGGIASTASQTGQKIVERDLQRVPTLQLSPGWPVRLIVDKDLVLTP